MFGSEAGERKVLSQEDSNHDETKLLLRIKPQPYLFPAYDGSECFLLKV